MEVLEQFVQYYGEEVGPQDAAHGDAVETAASAAPSGPRLRGRGQALEGAVLGAVGQEVVDAVVALLHLEQTAGVDAGAVQGGQSRGGLQSKPYDFRFMMS